MEKDNSVSSGKKGKVKDKNKAKCEVNIDDLFDSLKKRKSEKKLVEEHAEKVQQSKEKEMEKMIKKKQKVEEQDSSYGLISSDQAKSIISPEAPIERIDKETGFPVYKAHLLKVGEGGGTTLCPFDCDCCF